MMDLYEKNSKKIVAIVEFGLDYLYTHELSQWAKRDFEEKSQKKYYEQFQWPLALAVIFLGLSL